MDGGTPTDEPGHPELVEATSPAVHIPGVDEQNNIQFLANLGANSFVSRSPPSYFIQRVEFPVIQAFFADMGADFEAAETHGDAAFYLLKSGVIDLFWLFCLGPSGCV